MSENSNTPRSNISQSIYNAGNIGNIAGNIVGGGNVVIANNLTFGKEKRVLAEAATEIQLLLKRLEQTNLVTTDIEKVAYINDETSPSFKRRVVSALQASGEPAIEEFFDYPYVNLAKAVIKGWMRSQTRRRKR